MSNQQSNFTSTSYSSSSYTTSSNGGAPQTTSHSERTFTDPSGTHIVRTSQEPGQEPKEERLHLDAQGRLEQSSGGAAASRGRIEEASDADRLYDERIEDEYAKREGGA